MKPHPIRRYRVPRYPAKLQVISDPDLLLQHTPPTWRAVPEMAGAVALLLAMNETAFGGQDKAAGAPAAAAIVAPVFEHGEGRGVIGCIVVSPPVFLSEEEALQVIQEELGRQGVQATQTNLAIPGVSVPQHITQFEHKGGQLERKTVTMPGREKPLKATATDAKKKVAVTFVSQRNYHDVGGPFPSSSVHKYDFKGVAASLAKTVKEQATEKVYFGTLYDPAAQVDERDIFAISRSPEDWRQVMKKAYASKLMESKRLLRLQVHDFIKWLQAQGAI